VLAVLAAVVEGAKGAEAAFQVRRRRAGLDHYQVRGEEAWYRHVTLSMVAHTFLVTTELGGGVSESDCAGLAEAFATGARAIDSPAILDL
jgi:hypothetical protein